MSSQQQKMEAIATKLLNILRNNGSVEDLMNEYNNPSILAADKNEALLWREISLQAGNALTVECAVEYLVETCHKPPHILTDALALGIQGWLFCFAEFFVPF